MAITIKCSVIMHSGLILFTPGQEADIDEILWSEPYYGRSTGTHYPARITGVKLKGMPGSIWLPNMFNGLPKSKDEPKNEEG